MNRIIAVILCLFLLLVLVPRAVMNPYGSSYDPMSDVNRDKTIDIYDLNRLGRAYGSTQTTPTQPGKTTIYVCQLETDPPQIENAIVVIAELPLSVGPNVVQVGYTNSSGMVNFTSGPSTNYTAIAWINETYNYANFTTDGLGGASATIRLGKPSLPAGWVFTCIFNTTSRTLVNPPEVGRQIGTLWEHLMYDIYIGGYSRVWSEFFVTNLGACLFDRSVGINVTGLWRAYALTDDGTPLGEVGFSPDESGTAFVVIYA